MRRPLFLAALFLVIVAALRLGAGGAEGAPPGHISAGQLSPGDELLLTGQVYQKDGSSVYLQSVVILESDAFGHSSADSRQENQYQEIPCQDNIIWETEEAVEIPLGRTVALEGVFYPCSPATNPGEFDAVMYYRTLGVGGRLRKARILAAGEEFWPLRDGLYELKCFLKNRLYRIFPEKEAAVMSALLLGDKKDLDSELKDLYKRNGILHILSISSLHITIIGMSLYRLLRKMGLPVCPAALGGSVLLLFYGGMTGFGVSACRAIGMYLIRMLGEAVGRTYDMLTALGVMGAVMVVRNPYYLQNSGFLLSFGSVLGIGLVSPALTPAWRRGGDRERRPKGDGSPARRMREAALQLLQALADAGKALLGSALASLSITLATLPIQLWFYYEIPVYSVFLNQFVLPLMKPMMITGLLAMLVPGLGFLGAVDTIILKSYEFLCGCFDELPFHTWNPGCPAIWQIVAYYLLLAGVVLAGNLRKKSDGGRDGSVRNDRGVIAAVGADGKGAQRPSGNLPGKPGYRPGLFRGTIGAAVRACGLAAAVLLFALRPPARNSVTFLDVGQGDCILVRTASGENYLFDCGSSSRSGVGRYVLLPYLKYNGISDIDVIFLSHPDADHVNGAVELLEIGGENHISIGQLVLPAIEESARREQLGELLDSAAGTERGEAVAAAQAGAVASGSAGAVPVGYIKAGDCFECDSASFLCLHPGVGVGTEDVNGYSECFYVEFSESSTGFWNRGKGEQRWTMLLTGDVQNAGEEMLQRELQERDIGGITVLKAAHHGSKNSTPKELLERLSPLVTVISSGRNNRYGHPHGELLERLEESGTVILRTAQSGAITITASDGGIRASGFCMVPD